MKNRNNKHQAVLDWISTQAPDQKADGIIERFCEQTGYQKPRVNPRNWRPSRETGWRRDHVVEHWPLFQIWWQMTQTADQAITEPESGE